MKKNFVLDTNVLLHDPNALYQFADNDVVIPIYVFEELDKFKRNNDALGHNARQVSREVDELRQKNEGNLSNEGVKLPTGGKLRVLFIESDREIQSRYYLDLKAIDSKILSVTLKLKEREPEKQTILISKDINLRIRADTLGIETEDYKPEKTPIDDLYTGTGEYTVSREFIDTLYRERAYPLKSLLEHLNLTGEEELFLPNQCLLLRDKTNEKHAALTRITPERDSISLLSKEAEGEVWGIRARNKEQRYALELLLDPRIKLVTLVGKAGTGKTLIALAAALQQTLDDKRYQRLLVSRPVLPMGRDLGYLPGSIEEKMTPWMKSIFDNLEFLFFGTKRDGEQSHRTAPYKDLVEMGVLQIEPLTYIRGRSIPGQFIIIDEAQNLTPHEVKTIITRAGEDTKVVLTGDPYQIDHPYIDSSNNGLVHTVSRFKGQKIFGHVTLTKGERSELAELAANLL